MSVLNMLSPGILVNEVDLTTIIPSVSTSVGAYVGEFNWGPVDYPTLINDENQLLATFGKPTAETSDSFVATSFFSCANFLSYTNALYVVRTVNSNSAFNSSTTSTANKVLIKNEDEYTDRFLLANNNYLYGDFVAKYPGKKGNSLKLEICANTQTFESWKYKAYFDNAPGTSNFIIEQRLDDSALANTTLRNNLYANDEMHIIVVDSKGEFTGKANTVIEKFPFVSKSRDVIDINGRSGYYKNVLLEKSNYVYALDFPDFENSKVTWGTLSTETENFHSPATNLIINFNGGADGAVVTAANVINNWAHFTDKDKYEISLAFVGASVDLPGGFNIIRYVLDQVILGVQSETPTQGRKDTMLFISPRYSDVVDQSGREVDNIATSDISFLKTFDRSSSYCVVDSGWKYQYDRYNNVYRWIPLNADIAGLCAHTDLIAESWYSPAGFNRGKIKNSVKLAWSPNQGQRDALYQKGINPVISVVGEGTLLLGDKTLQAKPSAFDRINVRRLFIVLEKAISRAARYSLFEFNDAFTRAQFVALVEPYLRTIQGRRGIIDFKVVCDESNNTGDIIDRNAFVGDIYIKPARSINFIQLNFVAVKTGVDFSTVVGQF